MHQLWRTRWHCRLKVPESRGGTARAHRSESLRQQCRQSVIVKILVVGICIARHWSVRRVPDIDAAPRVQTFSDNVLPTTALEFVGRCMMCAPHGIRAARHG